MDPESSVELVRRAQAGDQAALNRLIERYRPRLRRWATGRLPRHARDFADTEDLVQEALLGTIRNFEHFQQRGEWAFQAYLRRAVLNRVRDEIRRFDARPRRQQLPDRAASHEPSPLEAAVGHEFFERYEAALAVLSEVDREAVIAKLELGCTYDEIALLVDKPSPDAARMCVSRALDQVARLMSAS